MTETLTGGCQCGAIRYACSHADRDAYYCHCRMCQQAMGNVAAAFWDVPKICVSWTAGTPAYHMSSRFGRRGFCGTCGTPLTFDYPDSARMDLTVGSLDDPAAVALSSHFGVESRVPGWIPDDDLPVMRSEDYKPLQDRWAGLADGSE